MAKLKFWWDLIYFAIVGSGFIITLQIDDTGFSTFAWGLAFFIAFIDRKIGDTNEM